MSFSNSSWKCFSTSISCKLTPQRGHIFSVTKLLNFLVIKKVHYNVWINNVTISLLLYSKPTRVKTKCTKVA